MTATEAHTESRPLAASRVLPDRAKAALHRRIAEPGSGED